MKRLFAITLLFGSLTPALPALAQTAPTLVSYTQAASWITGGASKSTASVSWNSGDLIVACGGAESNGGLGTPTATGLTFSSVRSNAAANTASSQLAYATAASTSSSTITMAYSGSAGEHWGFGVWVFRSHGGTGNSAEQHTSTRTVSLTPAGGAHSAMVYCTFDYAAATAQTVTPTPTDARQAAQDTNHYTLYVDDLTDQASSGANPYGIGGTGSGPFSIVVLEVKGVAASGGRKRVNVTR
jgi:hypothetical protein